MEEKQVNHTSYTQWHKESVSKKSTKKNGSTGEENYQALQSSTRSLRLLHSSSCQQWPTHSGTRLTLHWCTQLEPGTPGEKATAPDGGGQTTVNSDMPIDQNCCYHCMITSSQTLPTGLSIQIHTILATASMQEWISRQINLVWFTQQVISTCSHPLSYSM